MQQLKISDFLCSIHKKESRAEAPGVCVIICVYACEPACLCVSHFHAPLSRGEGVRASGAQVACSRVLLHVHSENCTVLWGSSMCPQLLSQSGLPRALSILLGKWKSK